MSTINSKNVQVGTSNVAAENFTLYQPSTPDGTVRLGVGNSGATTGDVVTVNSAGVTVTGTLTATTLSGSLGAATATSLTVNGNNISAVNSMGFRNRIINGDMRIDQRSAGASVTPAGGSTYYSCDRWQQWLSQNSKYSIQRSTTAPAGFTNSLFATSLSAYSVLSTDNFALSQQVEGFNSSDLGWGAAGAQTVTLSFWVRSSLTGTFGGALSNSAVNRSYPFTYTISAANTWEQKTVTIAGDTTGTWLTDNGIGIRLWFSIGAGSSYLGAAGTWAAADYRGATGQTSVVGTSGATFYITGVQLEAGTVASPFERRDYGRELIMCQRYYYLGQSNSGNTIALGGMYAGNEMNAVLQHPVTMRAAPSFVATSGTNYYSFWANNTQNSFNTLNMIDATASNARLYGTVTVPIGYSGFLKTNNASSSIAFNAEL